jgi:hypothetical protein
VRPRLWNVIQQSLQACVLSLGQRHIGSLLEFRFWRFKQKIICQIRHGRFELDQAQERRYSFGNTYCTQVRFGSGTSVLGPLTDVRFSPNSGRKADINSCRRRADFVAEVG